MFMNATALAEEYRRQKESLLAQFPELAEDGVALADTLEGITQITDVVAHYIRDALEDEALAKALSTRQAEMSERRARLEARADKRRAIALAIMDAAGMPRIEQPEFTAGPRPTPGKVVIADEKELPDGYCKFSRAPDKTKLRDALMAGATIPGVTLGNGGRTLAVRVK